MKYNEQIQATMTVNDRKQNFHKNPSNKNYANCHDFRSDMKDFKFQCALFCFEIWMWRGFN